MEIENKLWVYGDTNEYTEVIENRVRITTPCPCGCDEREGKNIGSLYIIYNGTLNGIKFRTKNEVELIIQGLKQLL